MFTGIVEHVGIVLAIEEANGNRIVTIGNAAPVLADAKVGDQMSVNGAGHVSYDASKCDAKCRFLHRREPDCAVDRRGQEHLQGPRHARNQQEVEPWWAV